MAHFRLSGPAQEDVAAILESSAVHWGPRGRHRYATLLATALREVANTPKGPMTRPRGDLGPGLRSFHLRHLRTKMGDAKVRNPVHLIYYRVVRQDFIEVVRVLHERMDPDRHIG